MTQAGSLTQHALPLLFLCLTWSCSATPDPQPTDAGPTTLVDPLSIPASPTVDPKAINSADECAGCHKEHTRQWRMSRHAFAMRDPVFQRLVELRNATKNNTEDGFCTQCHSTVATRGGDCDAGFQFDALPKIAMEGITCESCHKSTEVVRVFNAGHVLDDKATIGGPLKDPVANSFHGHREAPHMGTSEFCGSCHDVIETSGLPLERPYAEWSTSPAAKEGQQCQDCHMPLRKGTAAVGGPEREVHSHLFIGVEAPTGPSAGLTEAERDEVHDAVEKLLLSATELALEVTETTPSGGQLDLVMTVYNKIGAHNFPTGSTFLRQVWLDVHVTDAKGAPLYRSGDLDANGDLRDHWSELDPYGDSDLITLSSRFIDLNGNRTIFTWEAAEHTSEAIEPLKERTWTLFVPVPSDATGPLKVAVKLRFRAYGPFLLRLLGLADLVPQFPIWDIASAEAAVKVTP